MATTFSKNALKSLTAAALAIPGIAQAEESTKFSNMPAEDQSATATAKAEPAKSESPSMLSGVRNDLKFTRYMESKNRYDINVWQGLLVVPYKDFEFELNFQRDGESGATEYSARPRFTVDPSAPGPTDIVTAKTGPTVQEDRSEVTLSTKYKRQDSEYGLSVYYSAEDDVKVPGVSLLGRWNFNKNNTVLQLGGSVSSLSITPSSTGFVSAQPLNTLITRLPGTNVEQKYYLSLMQTLSKYNYVQMSVELQHTHGFINDHYRVVYGEGDWRNIQRPFLRVFTAASANFPRGLTALRELKPNNRTAVLPLLRFVQYIPATDGSVHLDYRYGANTWAVQSHMLELTYHQPFMQGWVFSPKVRYYTQSHAKFYGPTYNLGAPNPAFRSVPFKGKYAVTDHRLGGYGTVNFEAKLNYKTESRLGFGVTAGYYQQKSGYKLGRKDAVVHPELVGKGQSATYLSAELNVKL